ncbi:MAG: SRPBCC domain-containing protein [Chitinophagaceae bacterium]
MDNKNYATSLVVDQSPKKVFDAINNVRGWWSINIEGNTTTEGDEFVYFYKDVHISKMKIVTLDPFKKVEWLVLENEFNFTKEKNEWKGNKIVFQILEQAGHTKLFFTQEGLTPSYECYLICHDAWTSYIQGSLKSLIQTGTGMPNPKEGGLNEELIEKWNLPKK